MPVSHLWQLELGVEWADVTKAYAPVGAEQGGAKEKSNGLAAP